MSFLFSVTSIVYDVDYVTRIGREVLWRGRNFTKRLVAIRVVLILALNCYQHCLEHSSFYNANYFEAYT